MSVFDFCPFSYIFDLRRENLKFSLNEFYNYFLLFGNSPKCQPEEFFSSLEKILILQKKIMNNNNIRPTSSLRNNNFSLKLNKKKINIYSTFKNGKNFWLLKPIDLNRGRGIKIFNDLSNFSKNLCQFYNDGIENEGFPLKKQQNKMNKENFSIFMKNKVKSRVFNTNNMMTQFVIQKYIEKPLLIKNRKFDIRVWALITQDLNLYFYE